VALLDELQQKLDEIKKKRGQIFARAQALQDTADYAAPEVEGQLRQEHAGRLYAVNAATATSTCECVTGAARRVGLCT